MVSHAQQTAEAVNQKPTTIYDPASIERIDFELFRAGGTCSYAEQKVAEFGELPRATVEMLIMDAQRLIDACKGALEGVSA